MEERRRHRRIAVKIPVRWKIKKGATQAPTDAFLFDTRNIARRGAFLRTSLRPQKGSPVELELNVRKGSAPIKVTGKIVWVAKKWPHSYLYPGIGIEFGKTAKENHKKLDTFLRNKFNNIRDAIKLKKMYLTLKGMASELVDLEERHASAVHFKKVLSDAISEIDEVAHMLDKEINEVKRL